MTGPDGQTVYYLSDSTSITAYGQVQKIVTYKNIVPISNGPDNLEYASNALYDAAAATLNRHKDTLVTYSLSCIAPKQTIYPGDKIWVTYKDIPNDDGAAILDVNQEMWVMAVNETASLNGSILNLTVSTVDRVQKDAASVLVGALESIQVNNTLVQPSIATYGFVYTAPDGC